MLSLKEIVILSGVQAQFKRKCKNCGCSRLLGKQDRVICKGCGHWIYKDEETEFKYKMVEKIKKEKNNNDV